MRRSGGQKPESLSVFSGGVRCLRAFSDCFPFSSYLFGGGLGWGGGGGKSVGLRTLQACVWYVCRVCVQSLRVVLGTPKTITTAAVPYK